MKRLDFTKKIICSNPDWEVVQVIPVKFSNPAFRHALIIENIDGKQDIVPVSNIGVADNYVMDFSNPEPVVVKKQYVNLYNEGDTGSAWNSKDKASKYRDKSKEIIKVIETLIYDNGTTEVNLLEP